MKRREQQHIDSGTEHARVDIAPYTVARNGSPKEWIIFSRPYTTVVIIAIALFIGCAPASLQAAHAPHFDSQIRVGILLFNGVEPIDFAGPYEVFGQAGLSIVTLSPDGKAVTGMGLTVKPDYGFSNAPAIDVLVVPGGDVSRASHNQALLKFIRERTARARQVLSVCTGSYLLAAAGVLDGLKATTFHDSIKDFAASYPKIHVISDVRWADNGKVITSAGLASGIDAALHVLARLEGEDVARSTALQLEYDWHPDGGFVRTRMADRYLPDLQRLKWPDDARFGRLIAVGDTHQWLLHARITTHAAKENILSIMDDGVSKTSGWEATRVPHHWRKPTEAGVVSLSFSASPASAGGAYELEVALVIEEPRPAVH
jgi:putative intracellular protease/amidase